MFLGNDPGDILVLRIWIWLAIRGLESAGGEEPGHHQEAADEEGGTTTELVEVEDCGEGHGNINDVPGFVSWDAFLLEG